MGKYEDYKYGHQHFQACCVPFGCAAGPLCLPAWTCLLPCTAFAYFQKMNGVREEMQRVAFSEGCGYHIIFERHYVWLLWDERKEDPLKVHKICLLEGIDEMDVIDNIDSGMRDGVLGACQDFCIPDLPGILLAAQNVDGDEFVTWERHVVIHHGVGRPKAHVHGEWKTVECAYTRRAICKSEQFFDAIEKQLDWCKENPVPQQETM